MAAPIVIAGMHVTCAVNGVLVGRVTRFRWSKRSMVRAVGGVDQLLANELVRGPIAITGTIGLLHTRRDGGAEGAGLIAPLPDLLQEQYVSIVLRDRSSDTVLQQFDRCLIETEEWEATTKDIVKGSVSFVAISASGAVRPRSV